MQAVVLRPPTVVPPTSSRELLGPFWYDVQIFLWCAPCIVVVGLLLAIGRNVRTPALFPLRLFATLYIDIVRGVPVILWITLLGFGVPAPAADPRVVRQVRSSGARSRSS